jgi:hypothetical protein
MMFAEGRNSCAIHPSRRIGNGATAVLVMNKKEVARNLGAKG